MCSAKVPLHFLFPLHSFIYRIKDEKKDLVVPKAFVALLKSVFAKLVGAKSVNPHMVTNAFWTGLPAKFRARKPRGSMVSKKIKRKKERKKEMCM